MAARSSELPADESGRQYHVGVAPGDVAPVILLVGDPDRARKIADRFESTRFAGSSREYRAYTGLLRSPDGAGREMTVLATGMGPDNTEIAIVELCQVVEPTAVIRVGSCGALQPDIALGDLVVSTAALRLENTTEAYLPPEVPAVAHPEAVMALAAAAAAVDHPFHVGLTATLPGFFAAQGRDLPDFPTRYPDRPAELAKAGVLNMEMEASCLFALGALRGLRTGAVCTVFGNRTAGEFTTPEAKEAGETAAIDAALGAVRLLERMDEAKAAAGARLWHPGLGLGQAPTAV